MFESLRRKRGGKGAESKPPEKSREAEVAGEDEGNGGHPVDLLDDLVGRDISASSSVRSIIKAAISHAEQIVDSVKNQALEEAKQEAARVIAEAKKEAEKIRGGAQVMEETAEETSLAVEEAPEEQAEELAQTQVEAVAQKEDETVQLPNESAETVPQVEEPAVLEPVAEEAKPEEAAQEEEVAAGEETETVVTSKESQVPYTGEVELVVGVPVEPTMVAKLYNYLQTTAEVKFVRTIGSWNKGSTITISLDKPIPLISVLASKLPEANVVPEQPVKSGPVRDRRGVRRINISLKKK
jgi:hypothetical protein